MPASKVELCYAVLTPFKFRRAHVKPPAFVQMSAEEARIYQAAGVLGGEESAALPPEGDDNDGTDSETVDTVVDQVVGTVIPAAPAATSEAASTTPAAPAPAARPAPAAAKKKAPATKAAKKKAAK